MESGKEKKDSEVVYLVALGCILLAWFIFETIKKIAQ